MTVVYDWIKDIIYYLILMSLVFQLLPNENYRKYIKLFSGILLVIIVLKPLKIFVKDSSLEYVKAAFQQYNYGQQDIKSQVEDFKKVQEEVSKEYISGQLKEQIQKLVEEKGYYVESAEVKMQDEEEVLCINLLKEESAGTGITIEAVKIRNEQGQVDEGKESEELKEIKKEIAEYYQVEESAVQIQLGGE